MRPTIIHIINTLTVGGAEMLLVNTIPLLKNYEHVLICLSGPETLKQNIQAHIKAYYRLNVVKKHQWIKGIGQIRKIIRHHKPLLVHSHLQLSSILARLACPVNTPLLFTIHSTFSEDAFRKSRLALWLEKLTVKKRHSLIGVSRFVIDDYLHAVPFKGRVFTLYNFVQAKFFKTTQKRHFLSDKVLHLVAVGTLKEAKNYPFLLVSFKMLRSYPVHIDVYGEGPEKEALQKIISADNLNVTLKGSSGDLEKILPEYDAYVICSSHEGYGIAPLEAMACGLPVIASSIPVLKEVIGEDNAIFFELDNPENLASQIKKIIGRKELLSALSEKSRKRALAIASEEKYLSDLNTIYKNIIN